MSEMFVIVSLIILHLQFSCPLENTEASSSSDTATGPKVMMKDVPGKGGTMIKEYIVYGLAICAALIVTGTVIGLFVMIRRKAKKSKRNCLFGSVAKTPSFQKLVYPIGSGTKSSRFSSADDLYNVEARKDAGLAGYKVPSQDCSYEIGDTESNPVAGRGVQKWAVYFKVKYDVTLEHLEVAILRTSTIALTSGSSSSFIFFHLYLLPHESEHKQSSSRPYKSTTITFDETFYFRLKNADALSSILRLSLYTMDGDRTRACLGHVAQPLIDTSIFDGQVHYLTRDLGTLEAASMEGCVGEAQVSLRYDMQKEKLKMRLIGARNLPSLSHNDWEYYMRIDIVIGDRIVKTKQSLPRASLHDLFDCAYAFMVPCKHMEVCAFLFTLIQVMNNDGQEGMVKERPWGRFTIGPSSYAHGSGVDHWKLMIGSSKKSVEMWHVIARAY